MVTYRFRIRDIASSSSVSGLVRGSVCVIPSRMHGPRAVSRLMVSSQLFQRLLREPFFCGGTRAVRHPSERRKNGGMIRRPDSEPAAKSPSHELIIIEATGCCDKLRWPPLRQHRPRRTAPHPPAGARPALHGEMPLHTACRRSLRDRPALSCAACESEPPPAGTSGACGWRRRRGRASPAPRRARPPRSRAPRWN